MSRALTIQLSDAAFTALKVCAEAAAQTPAAVAAAELETRFASRSLVTTEAGRQAARERFERHFGEVDLGRPTGADNDGIDADLARSYADSHGDA